MTPRRIEAIVEAPLGNIVGEVLNLADGSRPLGERDRSEVLDALGRPQTLKEHVPSGRVRSTGTSARPRRRSS
jgi:hypothetical protein